MSRTADATSDLLMTDPRDVRAMRERLGVYEQAPDLYLVYSEEGTEYKVDAESGACTCPDATYRQPQGGCKHARRNALWRGDVSLPEWVNLAAVDPLLVEHLGLDERHAPVGAD